MPSPGVTKSLFLDLLGDESATGRIHTMHGAYDGFELLPDMTQAAGKDPHFDVTGTGTIPAPTFLAGGGILLATRTTSAADNDAASLFGLAQSVFGQTLPPTIGHETLFEAVVRVGASIAQTAIIFGLKLTDTHVYATDANQVLFVFDTDTLDIDPTDFVATANWSCLSSIAGVDTVFNSLVPVVVSTNYLLKITIDTSGLARFYINNRLITTTNVLTAAAALLPYFAVVSRVDAGGAKSHGIRWVRRSRKLL